MKRSKRASGSSAATPANPRSTSASSSTRARRVITPSGRRLRGKFPSQKLGRMVHWESLLERDAILHFEYHPWVVSYQEQPSLESYYDSSGVSRKYFPDFKVDFEDGGELIVEVKPSRKLHTIDASLKYGAIAHRFEEQGRPFRILTETALRREPLFSNLKRLHEHRRKRCEDGPEFQSNESLIAECGITTFGKLMRRMGSEAHVLHLLSSGVLRADLEAELCETSVIASSDTEGGPDGAFRI